MKSLASLALLAACALAVRAADDYQIVARYPIGGDKSGYDYVRVDAAGGRIYLAHEKRFEVLDYATGRKVGEIGPVSRAHGVAISPETGHGFASSGIDDEITMFDTKTLATIRKIKSTGSNPDAIEYDAESKKVYAGNHGGGGITVLDPATGDVVGTIAIDGKLEAIGFDGRGQGFVNLEDKSSVAVFDTHALKQKAVWSSAPGEGGTGLAVDAAHHRVFSACGNNKVVVFDSDSGKVVATPECGEDPDGIAYDPKTRRIFTPNPDGTMTIIQQESPDKYTSLQTVKTAPGCRTIGLDATTGRVVTCAPKFGAPPPPVKGGPKPKPVVLPNSFEAIVVGVK